MKEETSYNPLDLAEIVIMDRDWVFDRPADGELIAEVSGAWCNYRIWFTWQEDSGGLTLSCALDSKLPKQSVTKIHSLLALVNEKRWFGCFPSLVIIARWRRYFRRTFATVARYRHQRMRPFLSCFPIRRLGRQERCRCASDCNV